MAQLNIFSWGLNTRLASYLLNMNDIEESVWLDKVAEIKATIQEVDKNNFYIKLPKLGWHFGYIPYSNSVRKGRLVYFSEDIDKIDKIILN